MNEIITLINSIYPVSPALAEKLTLILNETTFPKRGYLLKAGSVCKNIYFIRTGLVRCFYHKNDQEVCSWFMKEGDFMISVESFFKQTKSYESIQALEDTIAYALHYEDLQSLYTSFPEFNVVGRVLTEKYYVLSEQRLYSIRMQRAGERYKFLLKNNPELIQRVSSKYLASYLGISIETLSRIRASRY